MLALFLIVVSITERKTAKSIADPKVINIPEIFIFTFAFLMALSEPLLSGDTSS